VIPRIDEEAAAAQKKTTSTQATQAAEYDDVWDNEDKKPMMQTPQTTFRQTTTRADVASGETRGCSQVNFRCLYGKVTRGAPHMFPVSLCFSKEVDEGLSQTVRNSLSACTFHKFYCDDRLEPYFNIDMS
jgi:hypothetical protein